MSSTHAEVTDGGMLALVDRVYREVVDGAAAGFEPIEVAIVERSGVEVRVSAWKNHREGRFRVYVESVFEGEAYNPVCVGDWPIARGENRPLEGARLFDGLVKPADVVILNPHDRTGSPDAAPRVFAGMDFGAGPASFEFVVDDAGIRGGLR